MTTKIGEFDSKEWGRVEVHTVAYHDGNLGVQLCLPDGEPLARLSVNLPESGDLPPNCFYVKNWSENERIALEAHESGLFRQRPDIPPASSGYVMADAWEILGEDFDGAPIE